MLIRVSLKNPYALFAICMILLVLGPARLLSVNSESLGPKEIRDLAYFTVRQQIATIPGISFGPPLGEKVRQITVFLDQQRMFSRTHDRTGVV